MEQVNCEKCGNKECANTGLSIPSYCGNFERAAVKPNRKTRYHADEAAFWQKKYKAIKLKKVDGIASGTEEDES